MRITEMIEMRVFVPEYHLREKSIAERQYDNDGALVPDGSGNFYICADPHTVASELLRVARLADAPLVIQQAAGSDLDSRWGYGDSIDL